MPSESGTKIAYLVAFSVVSIAVVGYFVGLQSPMSARDASAPSEANHKKTHLGTGSDVASDSHSENQHAKTENPTLQNVIPATSYADMNKVTAARNSSFKTTLTDFHSSVQLTDEVTIAPGEKEFALQMRELNRAFNGAPPTIPHPVDDVGGQSCMACHGEGIQTETLRISKMSHQFLTNCTQCHVQSNPQHMSASLFRENSFVGLQAPNAGHRAFDGAPPMIPHSTWMRVECASCHGTTGLQGIKSTHPWRTNCQQCHVPSSQLDRARMESNPKFLAPIRIEN